MVQHNQGYEVTFDGVSSDTIPEYICERVNRQLIGARRDGVEMIPGMPGGWLFPEQPGMRTITLVSHVLADSFPLPRRSALNDVANWVDKPRFCKLILGDDPGVYNMAVLAVAPDLEEWREHGAFELEFQALPYTFDLAVQTDTEVSASASKNYNIDVVSDIPVDFESTVTVTGPCTAVIWSVNGRSLTVTRSIPTTTSVTMNGVGKVVNTGVLYDTDLQGDFNPATLVMANVTGRFPKLNPGANSITVTAIGSTGFTANTYWRGMYR